MRWRAVIDHRELLMNGHKFKVGQLVNYFSRERASGVYEVTQLLPPEGDVFQYRIKNPREPHERVVKEHELGGRGVAPAELFLSKRTKSTRSKYRRFATAAEAIRYAVEDLPALRSLGAWMQVGDERFNSDAIQCLYDDSDYTLSKSCRD